MVICWRRSLLIVFVFWSPPPSPPETTLANLTTATAATKKGKAVNDDVFDTNGTLLGLECDLRQALEDFPKDVIKE
jgi:hypothetical protein